MSSLTPNYGLTKEDATDPFGSFRQNYNDNMDIIDQNLGGGGSGGHTIIDENGQSMTQRTGLEFTGNVQVTDDSVNDKTIVDILGGGGNVYGAFVDPSRIIVSSAYTSNLSYTATEDCFIYTAVALNSNTGGSCAIDGQNIASWWNGSGGTVAEAIGSYLKKGQTFTATASNPSSSAYIVYGLTQGTNGIFAPVIYSDNERVIGVWRDNKPLYQRTFVYTPSATISTTTVIANLSSEIEVKDIKGVAVNSQNDRVLPLCYAGNNFGTNFGTSASNELQIEIYSDTWGTNYTFFATVQYTKTTDVAGSGNWNTDGVPTHHYSTSEQVVGTYFGKPLYEKTNKILTEIEEEDRMIAEILRNKLSIVILAVVPACTRTLIMSSHLTHTTTIRTDICIALFLNFNGRTQTELCFRVLTE